MTGPHAHCDHGGPWACGLIGFAHRELGAGIRPRVLDWNPWMFSFLVVRRGWDAR
jgi:hypothetical protein